GSSAASRAGPPAPALAPGCAALWPVAGTRTGPRLAGEGATGRLDLRPKRAMSRTPGRAAGWLAAAASPAAVRSVSIPSPPPCAARPEALLRPNDRPADRFTAGLRACTPAGSGVACPGDAEACSREGR